MSARFVRFAAIGAGLAAAAVLTASVSDAATATYTVKAGSAKSGTAVAIKGTTTGAGNQISFTDATSHQKLTCKSGTAPGATKVGKGRAGAGIGTITGKSTKFNGCTAPLGLKLTVTGSGTWKINATSYKAGVTKGTISAITAKVSGSGCSFSVSGSVGITYTNKTKILAVTGTAATLKVANAKSCFGIVNSGDKASFKAKYVLKATKAGYNPISITKP